MTPLDLNAIEERIDFATQGARVQSAAERAHLGGELWMLVGPRSEHSIRSNEQDHLRVIRSRIFAELLDIGGDKAREMAADMPTLPIEPGKAKSTDYVIEITGRRQVIETDNGRLRVIVSLPSTSSDTEFVEVSRGDGEPMLGVILAHGETSAGYWPGGEDWSDEVRVPNPLGEYDGP